MVNFVCIKSGSGPHTLSTLCFKPCMENESELALDTVPVQTVSKCQLDLAQPKATSSLFSVDTGPDSHLCFSSLIHLHLHHLQVVFDGSASPALWVIAGTWHRSSASLPPPHGLGNHGLGSRDGCGGKDEGMNAFHSLISSHPGSQPCLSLTEVCIQCLGMGCVQDSGSLCLSSARNIDAPKLS